VVLIKQIIRNNGIPLSLYQYSDNNSINYIDNTGLWFCTIICKSGGVFCHWGCHKFLEKICISITADPPICFIVVFIVCTLKCGAPEIICEQICEKKHKDCK